MDARILDIVTLGAVAAAAWYFWARWRAGNQWAEKDKLTTSLWWDASVLRDEYIARGLNYFHWSSAELLAQRQAEGYEVVYELDKTRKTRYRIVNKTGQILMAKNNG